MVSDQGTHGCLKQTLFLPSWGLTDIRLGDNQGGPCVMGASGGGGGVAVGGFLEGITPERRYSRQRPQPSKGPRGGSEGWGGASERPVSQGDRENAAMSTRALGATRGRRRTTGPTSSPAAWGCGVVSS